ncbi:MAG TPA: prepilin-type N-terminal cleavage/methylation domain-containing protein [Bacteroidales bacterium]
MRELKGFTIIELIVVLVVSSILITICLKVYTDFNRYINRTLKQQASVNKVVWFAIRFKEDIFKADYITGDMETMTIVCTSHKISYNFFPNKVLIERDEGLLVDTVYLNIKDINIGYIKPGIINYVEFEYNSNDEPNTFTFSSSKRYSARFLFDSP